MAARPSMGKTSLVMNMAQHVGTKTDMTVGVFSLEMSKEQLFLRLLTSEARIDAQRMRGGFLGEKDWGRLAHGDRDAERRQDFHRRHAVHWCARDAREVPSSGRRARSAPHHHRLRTVDAGARPFREPHARTGVDFAVAEGVGEGAARADRPAVAAQPRQRVAIGSPTAALRPARVGRPRARRRCRHVHLSRGHVRRSERATERAELVSPRSSSASSETARSAW